MGDYIPFIDLILFAAAVFLTNEKIKRKDTSNMHIYGGAVGFFGGIIFAIFANAYLAKKIKSADDRKTFHSGVLIGIMASIILFFLFAFSGK
jgi:capsular polysaccharide biosynthesis protein